MTTPSHTTTFRDKPYLPVVHRSESTSSIGTGEGIKPPMPSIEIMRASPRYNPLIESALITKIDQLINSAPLNELPYNELDYSKIPIQSMESGLEKQFYQLFMLGIENDDTPYFQGFGEVNDNLDNLGTNIFFVLGTDPNLPASFRRLCNSEKFAGNKHINKHTLNYFEPRLRFIAQELKRENNNELREKVEICILEAETNCTDRTAYFVETMYQAAYISHLVSTKSGAEHLHLTFNLGAAYYRLDSLRAVLADILTPYPKLLLVKEILNDIANKRYGSVESVETQLCVEHFLFDQLQLPINHNQPVYIGYNVFDSDTMRRIGYAAEMEMFRDEGKHFFEYMANWTPWASYLTNHVVKSDFNILLEDFNGRLEDVMQDESLNAQQIKQQCDDLMAEHRQTQKQILIKRTQKILFDNLLDRYQIANNCLPPGFESWVRSKAKAHEIREAIKPIQFARATLASPMQVKIMREMIKSDLPVIELGTPEQLQHRNLNPESTSVLIHHTINAHPQRAVVIDFHELTHAQFFSPDLKNATQPEVRHHCYTFSLRPLGLPFSKHKDAQHIQIKKMISIYPEADLKLTNKKGDQESVFSRATLFETAKLAFDFSKRYGKGSGGLGSIFNVSANAKENVLCAATQLYAELQQTNHQTIEARLNYLKDYINNLKSNGTIKADSLLMNRNSTVHKEFVAAFESLGLEHPLTTTARRTNVELAAQLLQNLPPTRVDQLMRETGIDTMLDDLLSQSCDGAPANLFMIVSPTALTNPSAAKRPGIGAILFALALRKWPGINERQITNINKNPGPVENSTIYTISFNIGVNGKKQHKTATITETGPFLKNNVISSNALLNMLHLSIATDQGKTTLSTYVSTTRTKALEKLLEFRNDYLNNKINQNIDLHNYFSSRQQSRYFGNSQITELVEAAQKIINSTIDI